MNKEVTIVIPMSIPKELNPNWQPRIPAQILRGIRAGKINQFKSFVKAYSYHAIHPFNDRKWQDWTPIEHATIEVTLVIRKTMKVWDETNVRTALKYAEDMLGTKYGAGVIVDDSPDHLEWLPIKWERGEPEIRIKIQEVLK